MADTGDHGYKCTCPSRKLPCKHVLALFWMFARSASDFAAAEAPEWVSEWVGRRRRSGPAKPAERPQAAKSLADAVGATAEVPPDPKAEARRKANAERRAAETLRAVESGLDELEQWVADQLRLGLSSFLAEAPGRCRRIAARLVDAKAAALASRLDEMPARLLGLSAGERPRAAIGELGKLVLLARAWRAAPLDPELRRTVVTAEAREAVLADPHAPRAEGTWEVLAERVSSMRDGLVSQATWLMSIIETGPRFAVLLDFSPASAGRRGGVFTPGERFTGELVFYPARRPLRALIAAKYEAKASADPWCSADDTGEPLREFVAFLDAAPWTVAAPVLLPKGRICEAGGGCLWWRPARGATPLPLAGSVPPVALGTDLDTTAGLWDGTRLELLAAQTAWGRIEFDA
jgi:hypothetical protein